MKTVLVVSALCSGLFSLPALAQEAFTCWAWEPDGQAFAVHAAVLDVGDEEGEVVVYGGEGHSKTYSAEYDEYRTASGEERQHFVFNFDAGPDALSDLDLDASGAKGTLELEGKRYQAECTAHEAVGRYVLLAGRYDARYRRGDDDNDLAFRSSYKAALDLDPQARPVTGNALSEAVRSCLFFRVGAYGEHIDARAQERLTKGFLTDLRKLSAREHDELKFFRSTELLANPDTLWEPRCSLLVEVRGKGTLMLNGTMMD